MDEEQMIVNDPTGKFTRLLFLIACKEHAARIEFDSTDGQIVMFQSDGRSIYKIEPPLPRIFFDSIVKELPEHSESWNSKAVSANKRKVIVRRENNDHVIVDLC